MPRRDDEAPAIRATDLSLARGGAFVVLNHDGAISIERGFIRPEDEKPHAATGHEGDAQAAKEEGEGGVEAAHDVRRKDASRMRRFVEAARRASTATEGVRF